MKAGGMHAYVVTNPGPDDPPKINGNYIRVKKVFGAWSWNEIAGGPAVQCLTIAKIFLMLLF